MNFIHFEKIIEEMGENPLRQGLLKTPKRAANAFKFLTKGYGEALDKVVNGALFDSAASEMVVIDNIEFYSLCEHHLLPFTGVCHVAYLPTGKVLGLSKIARIVDMYSMRLQIQEELTKNIAYAISEVTQAKGVGVIIEAKHFCMMMRGVKKQNSSMKTSAMVGEFQHSATIRNEFLSLIGKNS